MDNSCNSCNTCRHIEHYPFVKDSNSVTCSLETYEWFLEDFCSRNSIKVSVNGERVTIDLNDTNYITDDLYNVILSTYNSTSWYPLMSEETFTSTLIDLNQTDIDALLEDTQDYFSVPTEQKIEKVIEEFGGEAFVRSYNCSPKDSNYNHSLIIRTPQEIFTLFRNSYRVSYNIGIMKRIGAPIGIMLRQPIKIFPESLEFRCFYNEKLRAISRYRNISLFEDEADELPKEKKNEIENKIIEWFDSITIPYHCCTVDLVVMDDEVLLVEFNSFGAGMNAGSAQYHWIKDFNTLYNS